MILRYIVKRLPPVGHKETNFVGSESGLDKSTPFAFLSCVEHDGINDDVIGVSPVPPSISDSKFNVRPFDGVEIAIPAISENPNLLFGIKEFDTGNVFGLWRGAVIVILFESPLTGMPIEVYTFVSQLLVTMFIADLEIPCSWSFSIVFMVNGLMSSGESVSRRRQCGWCVSSKNSNSCFSIFNFCISSCKRCFLPSHSFVSCEEKEWMLEIDLNWKSNCWIQLENTYIHITIARIWQAYRIFTSLYDYKSDNLFSTSQRRGQNKW